MPANSRGQAPKFAAYWYVRRVTVGPRVSHHGQGVELFASQKLSFSCPAIPSRRTMSFSLFYFFSSAEGSDPVGIELPRKSFATQSPAQSFVPLTVPTSLHPMGTGGFT